MAKKKQIGKKISLITETGKDREFFTVLTFDVESQKIKGNHVYYRIAGESQIQRTVLNKEELKNDKLI